MFILLTLTLNLKFKVVRFGNNIYYFLIFFIYFRIFKENLISLSLMQAKRACGFV